MEESKRLIDRFRYAFTNRNKVFEERNSRNEFYYSDVEGTLSQLTERQQTFVKDSYNIPISTKLTYPIIEQMLSFLTGAKPFPKIISSNDKTQAFAEIMTRAFYAVWYESKADDELRHTIQDALVTGSGFMRVRKNNFFQESTFNTIVEHIPWWQVYIDPQSKDASFEDAEFMVVASIMTKNKAQKKYDIKISVDDAQEFPNLFFRHIDSVELVSYWGVGSYQNDMDKKWVTVLEFFEKVDNNVYISENGQIGNKKPIPIEIPNQDKIELGQQIQTMMQTHSQMETNLTETTELSDQAISQSPDTVEQYNQNAENVSEAGRQMGEKARATLAIRNQIRQMQIRFGQMPDLVPAYKMETISEETVIIKDYETIKKKMIKRTLMVNDRIIEKGFLAGNKYPIHHIYVDHNGSPNKTYGIIHKIKDLVMATNKMWSAMLYDVMSNNSKKVFYPEGSIEENSDVERKWNLPGGVFIKYRPDPTDRNGGLPTIVEPSPLNNTYPSILGMLQDLIEYITGIRGVMMGDNSGTTKTFGGIQSLQNFGTQRIKLYARTIENALADLAYTIVAHLQQFAPKDKVLKYFDENQDTQEIQLISDFTDTEFKVRVDITNSLPTQRRAAVQLLGMIAQTTADPNIAKVYTELMLKYMDMPESQEIIQKVDAIQQMQATIAQLQEALQEKEGLNKTLSHNMEQMKASREVDQSKAQAIQDIEVAKAEQMPQENPEEEEEQEFYVPEQGETY